MNGLVIELLQDFLTELLTMLYIQGVIHYFHLIVAPFQSISVGHQGFKFFI